MSRGTVAAPADEARPSDAPPDPGGDDRPAIRSREAVAVFAVATCTYLATLSAVPALTFDSMAYLTAIEQGGSALYHPHHLAYNVVSRVWLDAWQGLGIGGDPLRIVETLNAALGGLAATLIWLVLRVRAGVSRPAAIAATAGACLSYGFWFYSVSVEVYMLSLVMLLATFLALTSTARPGRALVIIGLLNGLAVVAHQVNVLFGIVVVLELVRGVDRATAVRRIAAYGATAMGVVVAAYGATLAFAVRPGTTGAAADWLTRYAQDGENWELDPTAPARGASGFGRSLVGGHFAYRLEAVRERASSVFGGKFLDDQIHLVRNLPPAVALTLICLAILGGALLVWTVVGGWRRRHDLPPQARSVVRPLATWVVVYALFFTFWAPGNPEFWIPQATALWMIAGIVSGGTAAATPVSIRRSARGATLTLAVAAVAVAAATGVGVVLPATDADNDLYAARYQALAEITGPGDLAVVTEPNVGLGYAARYAAEAEPVPVEAVTIEADVVEERRPPPGEIVERADRALARGHAVAIDAMLVDDPNDEDQPVSDRLTGRFASDWVLVETDGVPGWYLVEP